MHKNSAQKTYFPEGKNLKAKADTITCVNAIKL